MTRISIALSVIFTIGIVAGIPQRGSGGRGMPEFIKKCMEETGYDMREQSEKVTDAEACFSECAYNNFPQKPNIKDLKKKCDETGECSMYEKLKKWEECIKKTKATTKKCSQGSKYAQCYRKLMKNQ